MSEEERIQRLENAISTLAELAAEQNRLAAEQQRRIERLEESFVTLVQLAQNHDESLDELRAARAESELKFAELADAMRELAVAQAHADRRVDALVDIMREWRNGRS